MDKIVLNDIAFRFVNDVITLSARNRSWRLLSTPMDDSLVILGNILYGYFYEHGRKFRYAIRNVKKKQSNNTQTPQTVQLYTNSGSL